ncbi:MAG: bifunctional phosphoserine phosphatase/homoserine phosphotransferase ThrH [Nitrospinae bacterium]|nr:bifunctional phosphoserine phosphatase/homoserine phosphotransferase ThrH [Nitrospinota bacterium]
MLACLDLEGVLVPEIWIAFAEKTGIEKLRLTTRDIPDYDQLMRGRLKILAENNLKLADIQAAIRGIAPLEGAGEFLEWLRAEFQVAILSDTFYEFAGPLMAQLGYPILLCNFLEVNGGGRITDYRLRQEDGKTKAVQAFKSLNLQVIASGDSYNDTGMLKAADAGIFFRPPETIIKEFPQFQVTRTYAELRAAFLTARESLLKCRGH